MPRQRPIIAIAACFASLALGGVAQASIISSSPTLPPIGVPFSSPGGVGCFPLAGVCVDAGAVTFTSASSSFDASGQHITGTAAYSGILSNLAHVPIGPISLTGTIEEEVFGRTTSTQTGTWSTELLALSLSGPVLGHTLTLTLSASPPSTGVASIEQLAGNGPNSQEFRIDSFFDIFVDLQLDSIPPLNTSRGPIHAELTAVPEPASVALLAGSLLGLAGLGRTRRSR